MTKIPYKFNKNLNKKINIKDNINTIIMVSLILKFQLLIF